MKSSKFGNIIRGFQSQVSKRATKGERVLSSLFPNRGIGWPGGWGEDRLEQVLHLKNWTYVAIDAIACKIAQMIPNMAYVHTRRIPGKTQKYGESKIGSFGGTNVVDGMGHSFLTTGAYHRKALSVIKPHEELEPLPHDHLCRRLIEEPNAVDTAYDLLYEMDMFLELCGVAYLWAVPSKLGNPCELWTIPSHWVWPRTGGGQYVQPDNAFADRLIQYYEVRPWGGLGSAGLLRFPPNEVIMIPFKSPINKLSGYSKLTAGDQWIDSEESISKSRWSQFQNQARPELWMELGEGYNDPNDARIARIEAKFMNKYQGEGNYGKPIITPPGAKLNVLSFNPTEMAYFQCCTDDMECLTNDGWKKYTELTTETLVACYDKEKGALVYHKPSRIYTAEYDGPVHHWQGRGMDLQVTPDHRMLVRGPRDNDWRVERIKDLQNGEGYFLRVTAPVCGEAPPKVQIPKHKKWSRDIQPDGKYEVEASVWARFLGWYVSEGHLSKDRNRVAISQKIDSPHTEGIGHLLANLLPGVEWATQICGGMDNKSCYQWYVTNRGLYDHLDTHCGRTAKKKRLPRYMMSWPAATLLQFLDAAIAGDGKGPETDAYGYQHWYYRTTSYQLAEDVCEVAIKCGRRASVVKSSYIYRSVSSAYYTVHMSDKVEHHVFDRNVQQRSVVHYQGTIWCVTVPTSFFVVRRQGCVHVTGNSEEQIRDMILSLFRVPKAVVGISNDMTFGSILATLAGFAEFCLNPRLAMVGQRLTKFLGSRFNTGDAHVRIWWDNAAPTDPQQVNSDLQADFSAGAITTNEWRAIRGRAPYKHGGDDPLVPGPGGLVPLPLNTGDDLTELGKLVPTLGQQDQQDQPGMGQEGAPTGEGGPGAEEQGGEPTLAELAEGGDAGLQEGGKIDQPNGEPTKGLDKETLKQLDKAGLRKQWTLMEKVLDRATGGKTSLPDALEAMAELKAWDGQVTKSAEPDPEMELASQVQEAGEFLRKHTDPAPMPGYGQIFRGSDNQLWYVGGDGDEDGWVDLVQDTLGKLTSAKITCEAESFPPRNAGWEQLYPEQRMWGKSVTKALQDGPVAAGLAVVAGDTGRVLLIQRPIEEDNDNGGKWEFPGGKRDEGEHPLETAVREWTEEVGHPLPDGELDEERQWLSGNGKYAGHVYRVGSEDVIDLANRKPDADPASGGYNVVAWVHPNDMENHNLRPELLGDMDEVMGRISKYLRRGVITKAAFGGKKPAGGTTSASGKPCKPGQSAARTGCIPKKPKPGGDKKPKPAGGDKEGAAAKVKDLVDKLLGGEEPITAEHIAQVKSMLMNMTVSDIKAMKATLAVKAGMDVKEKLAQKIAERALGKPKTEEENVELEAEEQPGEDDGNVQLEGSGAGGSEGDGQEPEEAGGPVADEAGGPNDEAADGQGVDEGESPGGEPAKDLSVAEKDVVKRLKGYEKAFLKGGLKDQAAWMKEFSEQINTLGAAAALEALGPEKAARDPNDKIQYVGAYEDLIEGAGKDNLFVKKYLEQSGIVLAGTTIDPNLAVISSWSKKNIETQGGRDIPEAPQNYVPSDQTFAHKLEESKALPGLETSEDIHKIMGSKVTHFTPEVVAKLDERFGKGKWIVKSYGEEAYAGFGIFFPQRVAAIKKEARALMADARSGLKAAGLTIAKDKDGKVVGVSKGGKVIAVGTEEFGKLGKKVQKMGRQAIQASHAYDGAALPSSPEDTLKNDYSISFTRDNKGVPNGVISYDGKEHKFGDKGFKALADLDGGAAGYAIERAKEADEWRRQGYSNEPKFMVQPAFEAVGVSDADRALGVTWETAKEGRVHCVTRNGKCTAVPFATLMGRGDDLPAVFHSEDSRAMEKAVEDAINALPESERAGQMYAPDVMKTKDGWKVIELNPSAAGGGSNWLGQNPFVIDAVVSHMTDREPQHARFIRDLLKGKLDKNKQPFNLGDLGGKKPNSDLPTTDPYKKGMGQQVEKGEHTGKPCKPGLTAARTGCIAHAGSQGRTASGQMARTNQPGAIYTVKHGNLTSRYSIHGNKKINGPSIPLKNYQQQDDHSCGFVAALTLSRYFNPAITAPEVLRAVRPTKSAGVDEVQLKKALATVGVATQYKKDLTIAKLRKCVADGVPVLISVYPEEWSSDHWTIVQGFDNDRVYLTNHKSMSIAEFKKQWYVPGEGYLCHPKGKKPKNKLPGTGR